MDPAAALLLSRRVAFCVICALVIEFLIWGLSPELTVSKKPNAQGCYYNLLVQGFRAGRGAEATVQSLRSRDERSLHSGSGRHELLPRKVVSVLRHHSRNSAFLAVCGLNEPLSSRTFMPA